MKSVIAADHSIVSVAEESDLAKLRERIAALEALAEDPTPPEPKTAAVEEPQND